MTFQFPALALRRLGLSAHTLALVGMVLLASVLPARGAFADVLHDAGWWIIAIVFFLHGARLSTSTVIMGLTNWRLQLACLLATFLISPVVCLVIAPVAGTVLPVEIMTGLLFVGCLPSTVNSCIAFTSLARGNVAGAICAASLSNLLGVVLTPLMLLLLIPDSWAFGIEASALVRITEQVLVPFLLGQLVRPLISGVFLRGAGVVQAIDRGAILLIVFTAFSAGVTNGVWARLPPVVLGVLILTCGVVLGVMMLLTRPLAQLFGLARPEESALFYVGSTKSLATGLPMATALFAGHDISMLVLPIMVFHLLQLIVCAPLNHRHARMAAS
ncbi:bile acid:sodium symporter family protein [Celeribacter indicus]|uniref:Sodium/bile acid symporter family (MazG-like protein) n=1 Tax=Celeribacter indicus TaxID=1208324 RepID=A0A0B5E469_9RHOB|nr:bile acid:sodium symporter family protein [Celeribacter indicus]AJE47856.1 sodium/bile acid symporter family (MazG-like protein) [Celeribacter indicus]SDW25069.1 solute carrier family 10 (sodium/bile acid cotransporter), member 7 [Celeribacter indicus]